MTKNQSLRLKSIEQLYEHLECALNNPIKYKKLINACSTQEKLAAYHDHKRGIIAMSLGSFKKYANQLKKEISFISINSLRKRLIGRSQDISRKIVDKTTTQNFDPDAARLALIIAYNELLKIAKPLIQNDEASLEDFQQHMKKFRGVIGVSEVRKNA